MSHLSMNCSINTTSVAMQVQDVSDGSVSLVAQRDIAAGEDITLCYTNPFHGEEERERGLIFPPMGEWMGKVTPSVRRSLTLNWFREDLWDFSSFFAVRSLFLECILLKVNPTPTGKKMGPM